MRTFAPGDGPERGQGDGVRPRGPEVGCALQGGRQAYGAAVLGSAMHRAPVAPSATPRDVEMHSFSPPATRGSPQERDCFASPAPETKEFPAPSLPERRELSDCNVVPQARLELARPEAGRF